MWRVAILVTALALCGCENGADNASGGVTQAESDALNNAAEVLDAQAVAPRVAGDARK